MLIWHNKSDKYWESNTVKNTKRLIMQIASICMITSAILLRREIGSICDKWEYETKTTWFPNDIDGMLDQNLTIPMICSIIIIA